MRKANHGAIGKNGCSYFRLLQLIVVCICLYVGGNAFAASFSADYVKTEKGQSQTERFLMRDHQYRFDVVEDGQEISVLVDRTSGKTRIVNPNDKQYQEIENNGFMSAMNNPFEGYYMMCQRFEARTEGSETIDGLACDKVVLSADGKDLITAWVAKKYDFPIRIVNPATGDRAELKNIKEGRIDKAKFQVPAGYTEREDPVKKREREEAALPILTTTVKGQAPWARRIGPSGEMRVTVNPEKSVRIKFENFTNDESVFTIKGFRAGQPIDLDCQHTSFSLKGKGRRDECLVGVQNQAEKIAVTVEKGKILAYVFAEGSSFSHEDKVESFFVVTGVRDWGQGTYVDPKRLMRLSITSDSQDGPESKVKVTFYKDQEQKEKIDEIDVILANGKSQTLEYPAEKSIRYVDIDVAKGGGVQVVIEQPAPVKEAVSPKKPAVKKTSQPKPKVTDIFTVTHPQGTSKPLSPDKDLAITVTGVSGNASGTIDLYTDRNKSKKIDSFKFKLKKDQAESQFFPGSKQVGWATVWVHEGSFKVKLDQSPGVKAAVVTPEKKPKTAVPSDTGKAVSAGKDKKIASKGTIFNGEVPLMQGTKVLKETNMGTSGRVDMEVPANPEEVINFYKQAMTAKGWKPGISVMQGPMGVLQLIKDKSQFTLKATGEGQKSKVNLAIITR